MDLLRRILSPFPLGTRRNQRVLREDGVTNPDDYTAWFEMAIARPDLVRGACMSVRL